MPLLKEALTHSYTEWQSYQRVTPRLSKAKLSKSRGVIQQLDFINDMALGLTLTSHPCLATLGSTLVHVAAFNDKVTLSFCCCFLSSFYIVKNFLDSILKIHVFIAFKNEICYS